MIPEKINQVQLAQEPSLPANEINRTHTLGVYENGRIVGKFIYDRLSSALSLVHELKVLATIKFTQLDITDLSADQQNNHTVKLSFKENTSQACLVGFDQVRKNLRQQLDHSWRDQMPCSVILMTVLSDRTATAEQEAVFCELITIIGKLKGFQNQLFWYSTDPDDTSRSDSQGQKQQRLPSGLCLIAPSSGLVKARLLIDEIKRYLMGPEWSSGQITLCAAIGVKTTTDITEDELLAQAVDLLKKSIQMGGKLFYYTDTSVSSQVTVEERAQLFMISRQATDSQKGTNNPAPPNKINKLQSEPGLPSRFSRDQQRQ
jgi:hypothetical protein